MIASLYQSGSSLRAAGLPRRFERGLAVLPDAGVLAALESPRELKELLDRELDSEIRIYQAS